MKPSKDDNIRPGSAFWLVLIVIGGTAIWQKINESPKLPTDVRSSELFSRKGAEHMPVSLKSKSAYITFGK